MARYFARIIRAIIVAVLGVGGGVGMLIFIALVIYSDQLTAIDVSLKSALVIGLSFGCFMATILFLTDLTMRLFVAQGKFEEIWELIQTRQFEMSGTNKEVRRYCREALLAIPNLKSVSENTDLTAIIASTGTSWRSPGEKIEVTMDKIGENRWLLKCVSQCTQKNIAFDYAKNFENVESWLKSMNQLVQYGPNQG